MYGIDKYLKEHGLSGRLGGLVNGKVNFHNGWKRFGDDEYDKPIHKLSGYFKIISPDGIVHEGYGYTAYLKNNGLSARLANLINGKVDEYRGWVRCSLVKNVGP